MDKIKTDIEDMKQWQSFIEGWREGLEWEEGRSKLQIEVMALEEVLEQAGLTLDSGLSSLLTCPHCRHTFTRGWGLTNHRLVSFKSRMLTIIRSSSCLLLPREKSDQYVLNLLEGEEAEEMLDNLQHLSDRGKVDKFPTLC